MRRWASEVIPPPYQKSPANSDLVEAAGIELVRQSLGGGQLATAPSPHEGVVRVELSHSPPAPDE